MDTESLAVIDNEEPAPVDLEEKLIEEGEIAGDYLEQFLDILDVDGDIDLDVVGGRAVVGVSGSDDLTTLVGDQGKALDALQELTRLAVQQVTGERSRLLLDIAGYRASRRKVLAARAGEAIQKVLHSGDSEKFEPMCSFDRKIIHDAVACHDGVMSESEGAEPERYVVVAKL